MQLNVSCDASADEHEEGKNIKSTVPPAVSGGPEPSVNLSFECHEHRREETISPTATWPPNPPPRPVELTTKQRNSLASPELLSLLSMIRGSLMTSRLLV